MGGIVRTLTGGSKSKNSSGNLAYDELSGLLKGNISQGNSAFNAIGALLGIGGDSAAASKAYDNYLGSSGYKSLLDAGSQAITTNNASKGLLNSGATIRAQTEYGQELASRKFDDYIKQLSSLTSGGLDSAKVIAGAGQYSKGKGTSNTGVINSLFG